GETVVASMPLPSGPLQIGSSVVDDDGEVSFAWTVPEDTEPADDHRVLFLGSLSGEVSAAFAVTAADDSDTGGSGGDEDSENPGDGDDAGENPGGGGDGSALPGTGAVTPLLAVGVGGLLLALGGLV